MCIYLIDSGCVVVEVEVEVVVEVVDRSDLLARSLS